MKKVYLIVAFVTVLVTSCSSDSADSGSNPSGLLKEIQTTTLSSSGSTSSMTYKYSYTDEKLSAIKSDYWEVRYTYTGNLITSISNYDHGDLLVTTDYEYDSQDRMIQMALTEYQEGFSYFSTFSYNPDNTVTRLNYNGTPQNPEDLYLTTKITLDNQGRFIKVEDLEGSNWVTKLQTAYTNNNSPWSNIIGFDKLLMFSDYKNSFAAYAQLNNPEGFNNSSVFEYTLNSLNYPTQRIQTLTNSDGSTAVSTSNYIYY